MKSVADSAPRPAFHLTPHTGWINDPNGLVYLDGEYHAFYQHHPISTVWGPMHWGHAVSRDLLSWEELSIALAPDAIGAIFSGSAVIDPANTAGFGAHALVAIFTHDTQNLQQKQVQSLAYSNDRGRSWTRYSGNPVLTAPATDKDFRDPKVFWHAPSASWVMALAVASEIRFYRSANLKDWAASGRFGENAGSHGGVWECPELVELAIEDSAEKRWVLIVSVGNGAPAGGSGVQYFIGEFDGATFTSHDAPERVRWADYGADFYAPQAWNNAPGDRVLWLGWMNNWAYANQIPDPGNRRGAMSLPREVFLRRAGHDLALVQQPVRELALQRTGTVKIGAHTLNAEAMALDAACTGAHEIDVVFRVDASTSAAQFGLRVRGNAYGATQIGYDMHAGTLVIDRSAAAQNTPKFSAVHSAPLAPRDGAIALRIVVDLASIEVFADKGQLVMTEQIFPDPDSHAISLFATGGSVKLESLIVHELTPAVPN